MGPLWHGTQASGADETKHEGSNRIQALHVRAYSTNSMAVFLPFIVGSHKKKTLYVSLLILWSSTPCFLYSPCSLKPNNLRCIQVLYKKGNSSHSPARCSALAHASHLLIYSKAGALRYAQQRKLRYELMLIVRERAGGG